MAMQEERLEDLKTRSKRCVCKYCGSPLIVKRIAFSQCEEAQVELYCPTCQRIEYGVEPEIYAVAQYLRKAFDFNAYPQLDDNENTKSMNIAKICELLYWGNHMLGLLDEDGFACPVAMQEEQFAQITAFDEDTLQDANV